MPVCDADVMAARELLTLALAHEDVELDAAASRICADGSAAGVMLALVYGLKATWSSLEDFSRHIIAADAAKLGDG